MRIKGAIFDLDGTLLDSIGVWSQVDIDFLGKRGIKVPDDYADVISPMMFREVADYTISRFGLDETPEEVMDEWNQMAMDEYAHRVGLKSDADRVLDLLKNNGVKLAVATTNISKVFAPCLKRLGIYDMFDVITETDDVGVAKDKPDIYLITAKRLGVDPSECAVFEDIDMAIESAKKGGFTVYEIKDDNSWSDIYSELSSIL